MKQRILILFFFFIAIFCVKTQNVVAQTSTPLDIQAEEIMLITINGKQVRKLIGNVSFKREDGTLYADTVYQYIQENYMEAFGNVRINNADGSTVTGERMYYYTKDKQVRIVGNVVMTSEETTLKTPALDYNMASGIGIYTQGGELRDATTTLTSQYGRYNRFSKVSFFKKKVKLQSQNNELTTDSLYYHQDTKTAYFKTNTRINSKDGTVRSDEGEYSTITEIAQFYKRTTIESPSYLIVGDKVQYDKARQRGKAKGNVILTSKKDSITIEGDESFYDEMIGIAQVFGNALLKKPIDLDTLFIKVDTLRSVQFTNNQGDTIRQLFAYHDVKIYKNDLQGICDSLLYDFGDSAIYMYKDPVLWNEKSQLTADTVRLQLANNQLKEMLMKGNSFMVSEDTAGNYNQVKGKNMLAKFKESNLQQIDVIGGGQSIYFAIDEKTLKLVGMNHIICSDITLRTEQKKIKEIVFIREPEGRFIPPHEIQKPETKLKGFSWRVEQKPEKSQMTRLVN